MHIDIMYVYLFDKAVDGSLIWHMSVELKRGWSSQPLNSLFFKFNEVADVLWKTAANGSVKKHCWPGRSCKIQ